MDKKINLNSFSWHNEGFGRVLIESMLNKSLVIATSGGGQNEIISNGNNGVIIESDDPKVLLIKFCII